MTAPTYTPRQPLPPLVGDEPTGYMESDRDYVLNNCELAVLLLDQHGAGIKTTPTPNYTVTPYRYSKFQPHCVRTPSPDGYKTREARLAEHCGGRWVGRANGYLMTPRQLAKFQELVADPTKDASPITGELRA